MAAVVSLIDAETRARAKHWLSIAEPGVIVAFRKPTRTNAQNAKMWAMIADIRKQSEKHGRQHTADTWKAMFMRACEHEVQFAIGLDGEPFPVGFKSSHLSVGQMADLITFIQQWGDEVGIVWSKEALA
ncbi:MAG: recombination protein NinB [Pikeienuella sp.]